MDHYITEIRIKELRHLSNIMISLNSESREHLMITGKNGSGKTSLLLAIQMYLRAVNDGNLEQLNNDMVWLSKAEKKLQEARTEVDQIGVETEYEKKLLWVKKYSNGVEILFNKYEGLGSLYNQGNFVTAFYPANRKTKIIRARGVEDIKLNNYYGIDDEPGELLHKYMVHLKTQQAYARNEGDLANANRIQEWFNRFVNALRILLDDSSLTLEYDYKEYNFRIHEKGREPFGFDELSDGYSSVIHIVSDLILRMDKNWLLGDDLSEYDIEGIVLIDELETHLHIELQRKILPFLIKFFPKIQFIVTTHSPYILNSVSNARAYDLERCVELKNLSAYSSDGLAEGYFEADAYSYELKAKIARYECLAGKMELTEEERAERAKLRIELKDIPPGLAREIRDRFEEIEGKRL